MGTTFAIYVLLCSIYSTYYFGKLFQIYTGKSCEVEKFRVKITKIILSNQFNMQAISVCDNFQMFFSHQFFCTNSVKLTFLLNELFCKSVSRFFSCAAFFPFQGQHDLKNI